jgi:Zn finger protein HypA/HybF involved in hydrogenase expression
MHEAGLIKNLLEQVENQIAPDKVIKLTLQVSKTGGITPKHLRSHFNEYVKTQGRNWQHAELEIKEVEFGKDVDIIKVTFKEE